MTGRTVPELRSYLHSGDWVERAQATMGLAREGTNALAAAGELVGLSSDPVPQVRRTALDALDALTAMDYRAEALLPILVARLRDESWTVRTAAARILARQGRPASKAMPALVKCTRDAKWQVREAAIEALAEMRYPADEFLPVLLRALGDSAWGVRVAAAEALGELGPAARNAAPNLAKCARDPAWPVRSASLRALSRCEPPDLKPLGDAVKEKVAEVRKRMGEGVQTVTVDGFLVCVRTPALDEGRWLESMEAIRRSLECQRLELYGTNRPPVPAMVLLCAGEESMKEAIATWSSVPPWGSGFYDDSKRILFIRADDDGANAWHEISHLLMDADFGFLDGSWFTGGKGFTAWLNEGVAGLWEGTIAGNVIRRKGGVDVVAQVADSRHQSLLAALERLGKHRGAMDWQTNRLPPDVPPMTIDWLVSLPDPEFYRLYVGQGHLSMALARELVLYLNDKGKLREFYAAYKQEITRYPTSRRRTWNSERVAREALEKVLGVPMASVDADFLKWTTTRPEPVVRAGDIRVRGE